MPVRQPIAPPNAEPPALALSIDDNLGPDGAVEPGQLITYTLTFTNTGGSPVTGITVTAVTPLHAGVTAASLATWTCHDGVGDAGTPVCIQQRASLSPTEQSKVVFQVLLATELPANLDCIVLDASVVGENVVCGECGQASLATMVGKTNGQEDPPWVYLPLIVARG